MFLSQWPFSDYCANTLIIDMLIKESTRSNILTQVLSLWFRENGNVNAFAKTNMQKYNSSTPKKIPWQILQNVKEKSSLTVEVVIQELEQLVMLLSQVGEVDEKSEKTKRLVQPIRNKWILHVNMFLIVLMVMNGDTSWKALFTKTKIHMYYIQIVKSLLQIWGIQK